MPAENGVSYSGRISPFELSSAEKHLSLSFVSKASNHPFLEQSIILITSYHSWPRAQLRTNYLGLSSSEHSDNLAPYLKSERRNFGAAADVKRMKKEDEICARCTVKGRVFSFYQHPIRRELFIITSTFSSVQSLSRVRLFATPWTAARQASLSITSSWSFLKLMSMESVKPSNHLILCCPLLHFTPEKMRTGAVRALCWSHTETRQNQVCWTFSWCRCFQKQILK